MINKKGKRSTAMLAILLAALLIVSPLNAVQLPPDMQAAAEIEKKDPSKKNRKLMMNYIAVQRAELAELYKKRDQLQNKIDTVDKRIKAHKTWAWITIPLGILSTGAGVYFWESSEEAYQNYQDSQLSTEAPGYADEFLPGTIAGYALGGGGLALVGAGTAIALTMPDRNKLETAQKTILAQIDYLEDILQ